MAATSWFDNIRKFVSSVGQSNQQEQQPATTTTSFNASKLDSSLDSDGGTELRTVASDEEWLVVEKSSVEEGGIVSNLYASSEDVDSHKPLSTTEKADEEDKTSMETGGEAIDGGAGLLNAKKKSGSSLSPSLGLRSKSVSGSRSPRSIRPSSPSNLQRRASGRGPRPVNLEVQQNGSKHRSSSPSRHNRTESPSRASSSPATKSSLRVKKNASNSGSNSPTFDTPPSRAHSQPSSQQNSTAAAVNGTENGGGKSEDSSGGGQAFAAKIRDTLRISRPKRKKDKKKKGLAYSVDPVKYSAVEITSKYQDPFETSYAENGEEKAGHGHDFQQASIPHNKPEYCDHCGDMAWGLYRQVLKCSSESVSLYVYACAYVCCVDIVYGCI